MRIGLLGNPCARAGPQKDARQEIIIIPATLFSVTVFVVQGDVLRSA
jgi:hypothetical protein